MTVQIPAQKHNTETQCQEEDIAARRVGDDDACMPTRSTQNGNEFSGRVVANERIVIPRTVPERWTASAIEDAVRGRSRRLRVR
jgi:hypothetical protein